MGKQYPPDIIPDLGAQLPPGRYLVQIASVSDSDETSTGKYMIAAQLTVIEPKALANNMAWENFVIGTEADPMADDPETWKGFAARRYRDMLRKAGVELTGDVEQDAQAAVGQTVGALVVQEIEPPLLRNGQPNPFAGRVRSRVAAFLRPGEFEPGLEEDARKPAQAPAAAPAPRSAKPASERPSGGAPVVKLPEVKAVKRQQSMTCPVCDEQVPRDRFGVHVSRHSDEEE